MIRKILKSLAAILGYTVLNRQIYSRMLMSHSQNMESALLRLSSFCSFQTIIDVGAAKGKWSRMASKYWPDAKKYLFEPLPEQLHEARKNLTGFGVNYIEGVASDKNGEIGFNVSSDLDGSGIYNPQDVNSRKVRMYRIDDFIEEFASPCLLKLDTHGYEIPIFEGGEKTLQIAEAIIVEVYGFYVSPTASLFHDISAYLIERGFRLYDIVDIMRRSKDHAFWQADAVYLKQDHPIFSNNYFS